MAEAPTKIVKSMPHTFVAEDRTIVEMELEFENDPNERLRFSAQLFEQLMGRAAQLMSYVRSRTQTKGDFLAIQAVGAAKISAQAPAGGGKVILLIVGDNGIPMNLSLSLDQAEQLQPKLSLAIEAAKKEVSQSRH